ncbi:MAG: outer membrane protein assembly factor, partial [Ignavibacteria bacterium]|nr:outer membrane protein assembly factor [Ignavibacteria bacterium]
IAGLSIALEQPYLFNRSIIGRLEAYGTAEQKKYYRFFTLGAKIGLDFELPAYTFFNGIKTYLAYEREDRVIKPDFLRELVIALLISLNIQLPVGEDLDKYVDDVLANGIRESNSIIGLELFSNHTDDVFFPTKGYNLQVNFENAGLFPYIKNLFSTIKDPSVQYYKVNLTASIYTNPWKPSPGAVAYKFRIGYMQKFGGKKSISQNRNFFSGGSNSVRGWRAKGLGPVFTFYDQNNQPITITEIGGSFILEGSIESRHKFTDNLGGVVFIDYGNTWEDYKSTTWKNIAIATGFGFRYYTSFAPFRVDFGFEFYDPYSKKFIFKKSFFKSFQLHFGIGEAF